VVAVLDALRGEVFAQATGAVTRAPTIVRYEAFDAWQAEIAREARGGRVVVVGEAEPIAKGTPPRARAVGTIALGRAAESADAVEPFYVRAPDFRAS
jgi:hypothetical protein